jgi:hypothetical protein
MKVIIIDHEPFSKRKEEHYFINRLIDDGHELQFWAVNDILPYTKNVEYTCREKRQFVTYFSEYTDLIRQLSEIDAKSTIVILELWYTLDTLKIFEIIKHKGIKWVKIDYYLNPTNNLTERKSIWDIFVIFSIFNLKNKIKTLRLKLFYQNKGLNCPNILFICGSDKANIGKAKDVKTLDYFDIEIYNKVKTQDRILSYKYIVFLDIMLANHPDFQRFGRGKIIEDKIYFKKMNLFFEKIEKLTGFPVVIASHPKANYTDEYKGRICLKNVTAELVINSELVLTHGSLSISYALLSKIPLLYIYFDEVFKGNQMLFALYQRLLRACSYLNVPKINIDRQNLKDADELFYKVSISDYEKYLLMFYRKDATNQKSNYETLIESFNDLLDEH